LSERWQCCIRTKRRFLLGLLARLWIAGVDRANVQLSRGRLEEEEDEEERKRKEEDEEDVDEEEEGGGGGGGGEEFVEVEEDEGDDGDE